MPTGLASAQAATVRSEQENTGPAPAAGIHRVRGEAASEPQPGPAYATTDVTGQPAARSVATLRETYGNSPSGLAGEIVPAQPVPAVQPFHPQETEPSTSHVLTLTSRLVACRAPLLPPAELLNKQVRGETVPFRADFARLAATRNHAGLASQPLFAAAKDLGRDTALSVEFAKEQAGGSAWQPMSEAVEPVAWGEALVRSPQALQLRPAAGPSRTTAREPQLGAFFEKTRGKTGKASLTATEASNTETKLRASTSPALPGVAGEPAPFGAAVSREGFTRERVPLAFEQPDSNQPATSFHLPGPVDPPARLAGVFPVPATQPAMSVALGFRTELQGTPRAPEATALPAPDGGWPAPGLVQPAPGQDAAVSHMPRHLAFALQLAAATEACRPTIRREAGDTTAPRSTAFGVHVHYRWPTAAAAWRQSASGVHVNDRAAADADSRALVSASTAPAVPGTSSSSVAMTRRFLSRTGSSPVFGGSADSQVLLEAVPMRWPEPGNAAQATATLKAKTTPATAQEAGSPQPAMDEQAPQISPATVACKPRATAPVSGPSQSTCRERALTASGSPVSVASSNTTPAALDREPAPATPEAPLGAGKPPQAEPLVEQHLPVRTLTLATSSEHGTRVAVHLADRGGQIHVSVRTSDAELASRLRRSVSELVNQLEQAGYRAEPVPVLAEKLAWQAGSDGNPEAGSQSGAGDQSPAGREGSQQSWRQQQHQPRSHHSWQRAWHQMTEGQTHNATMEEPWTQGK